MTIDEACKKWNEDGRNRCDKKPHREFFKKITIRMVRAMMRTVISWKNDTNLFIRNSYNPEYETLLKTKLKDIPNRILERMFGAVYEQDGERYLYSSCCR